MGADLILTACELPIPLDADLLRSRVAELDDERLAYVYDMVLGERVDDEREDDWQNAVRELILQGIECAVGSLRDCTIIEVHGIRILITGGMTWGDTPTDSYDAVSALAASGVCP